MLMDRQRVIALLLPLLAILCVPATASGQTTYPEKTVHLVVPFPPAGETDIFARAISQKLGELLGQPLVIENRPGATGAIGSSYVAKSKPDGYTLLFGTAATHAINVSTFKSLPYEPVRDFAPVALVGSVPLILFANPTMPTDVDAFIRLLRSNPGKYSYGAAGTGAAYLSVEMFKAAANVSAFHVPYQGTGPVLQGTLAGDVQFFAGSVGVAMPMVKAGKLRALAVMSTRRLAAVPEVPTLHEAGLRDFEASTWSAVFAPAGTPAAITQKLNATLNRVLQDPIVGQRLQTLGIEPATNPTSEATAALVASEIKKWATAFKHSGGTPQ